MEFRLLLLGMTPVLRDRGQSSVVSVATAATDAARTEGVDVFCVGVG